MQISEKKHFTVDDVQNLGQGWIAEEALAIALMCALGSDNDFNRALVLSVNHSGDSDSTGAITGNIMGCLLGRTGIDHRWTDNLELQNVIQSLGVDLFIGFQDSEQWMEKYPGW